MKTTETNLDIARKNLLSKYLDDNGRLNINNIYRVTNILDSVDLINYVHDDVDELDIQDLSAEQWELVINVVIIEDSDTLLAWVGTYSEYDYTGKVTNIVMRVKDSL